MMFLSMAKPGKYRRGPKKHKANMVVTIIIFMLTFLVFCICAIDAGHVVVSRYKVQKVTETIALYMASYLNSKPTEERTKEALEPLKERFEDLYSASMNGFYTFKITDIELKNETTEPKVKISTEANIPTLFLKYAGIGVIRILQASYAKAETSDMTLIDSDTNSYTFEAADIVTDKRGDDIKVKFGGDYFIFAGIKNSAGEIFWSDLSYATGGAKKNFNITLDGDTAYALGCVEKGESASVSDSSLGYDFSRTDDKTIGFIKYVKIYKADCAKELAPPVEGTEGEGEEVLPGVEAGTEEGKEAAASEGEEGAGPSVPVATSAPEVTVLNSVRLIRKSDF